MPIFDDPWSYFFDRQQQQLPDLEALRKQASAPLPKEDQDSLLNNVVGAGMSGLHFAGSTLDKLFGGRAVRAGLQGLSGGEFRPRELLSVIPGSDLIGLTDEQQRVSGEDLAKQLGLLEGEGTKGELEARDFVGPGIEALTDPGTYLTFGGSALTKAGQAAKKAGTLEKTVAGRIAAGQGGLFGLGLPFGLSETHIPAAATGPLAQKAAAGLGAAGDYLRYSAPGRYLSAAFGGAGHEVRGGVTSEAFQRAMREGGPGSAAALREAEVAARQGVLPIARALGEAGLADQGPLLRRAVEGYGVPLAPELLDQASAIRQLTDQALASEAAAALKARELVDPFADYAKRSLSLPDRDAPARTLLGNRQLPTRGASDVERLPFLRGIPGGTETINRAATDPLLSGWINAGDMPARAAKNLAPQNFNDAVKRWVEEYLGVDSARAQALRQARAGELKFIRDNPMTQLAGGAETPTRQLLKRWRRGENLLPEEEQAANALVRAGSVMGLKDKALFDSVRRAPRAAQFFGGLDPQYAEKGIDWFGRHVVDDTLDRTLESARKVSNADLIRDVLGRSAVSSADASFGHVPLKQALLDAGIDPAKAGFAVADKYVPKELAADAIRLVQPGQMPGPLKPLVGLADKFTSAFRALNTRLPIFPSFFARNAASGLVSNLSAGNLHGLTDLADAWKLLGGGEVQGLSKLAPFAGMTDAEAGRRLAEMAFEQGLFRKTLDSVPNANRVAPEITRSLVGPENPISIPAALKEGFGETLAPGNFAGWQTFKDSPANPLNVRGARTRSDVFGLAKAGTEISDKVEGLNRLSAFLGLIRQGYEPGVAGELAMGAHGAVARMTPFEQNVMKRLVPFYSWTRFNTPYQLGLLAERPGGGIGQAIRLGSDLRQQEGFLPPYLGGGLAIPVGSEDETGTRRYLTKMGLPFEDPLELFSVGPGGLQKTAMKTLGQLNPLIKGPLEFATNRQFYSGRELDDLYSRTGLPMADQVVMNSPFAKLLTTVGTALDPRKDAAALATNLLTGARLSDVDLAKQRQVYAPQAIKDMLQGQPGVRTFEDLYVPAENLPQLTPDQLLLLRLYRGLEREAQQAAKQRKKVGG